ncbi:MAG TPA: carboxypeptidase-like regulatory domain-containing protein [Planctomycetota bacterium]|nr:carboxypeptidase-like regulatory domain-containing protein [Planctomycetota bacterium]
MPTHRFAFAVALCTFARLAPAQQADDPVAVPVVVRVTGHADGLPRPGVTLYVLGPEHDAPRVDAEGWLCAEDLPMRRLRRARLARTDPEGVARLRASGPWHVVVGEPFFVCGNAERSDDELHLGVGSNEPVGVRVLDAAGAPLAGFPVALHAAGKDLAVAITDATGKAILGVPKDFTARATIAPAGWVGPKQGFPSIAESLAGRRSVVLQLPPHGSLRLRQVRGGVPVRAAVHAVAMMDPTSYAPLCGQADARSDAAIGLTFELVGLGLELTCYSPFGSGALVQCSGPRRDGEWALHDVELGPLVTLRCPGAGERALRSGLQVRVVTDAGCLTAYASRADADVFVVDFHRALPGSTLRRVDLDAGEHAATRSFDLSLRSAAIDLGEFVLAAHAPQLSGRVVDETGSGVAGATVVVSPDVAPNTGYLLETDAEGRFRSTGPLVRGDDGTALQLVAKAQHGELASEAVRGVDGKVTLTLRRASPAASRGPVREGRLVAHVLGIGAGEDVRSSCRVLSKSGPVMASATNRTANGLTEVVFEHLAAGSYALLLPAPDHFTPVVLDGLEVPARGDCTDTRLQRLDAGALVKHVAVHVVDEQAVPVAGARIEAPSMARQTDGTGTVQLCIGREVPLRATVEAPGKRPLAIEQWPEEQTVCLEPAGSLQVAVRGLPADVPRENVEVWVRDEVRERFAGPRARFADGDVATMLLPVRGRYVLQLIVSRDDGHGGSSGTLVHQDPTPIDIGDAREQRFEFRLDDAVVERLRDALRRLR